MMMIIKYLEKAGMKVVPVYSGKEPKEFLVVEDDKPTIIFRSEMLGEAEFFIINRVGLIS